MERMSNKHSPRLDDELKHETQALERASAESRVEEFREQEAPGDYEPAAGYRVADEAWRGLGADPVSARRELSRHLGSHAFPAEREALVATANDADAPLEVVDALQALPQGITFANVYDVWAALGGPVEELEERPRRDGTEIARE